MSARPSGQERRAHARHDVILRVHVPSLGEVRGLATRDVSMGGIFLETDTFYSRGTTLPLALIDEAKGAEIPLMARVVRVARRDGKVIGLGLQFLHLHSELQAKVQALVDRVASGESLTDSALPGQAVPKIAPTVGTRSNQQLTAAQRHIVGFVNGTHSVDDIVRACGLEYQEAAQLLRGGAALLPGAVQDLPSLRIRLSHDRRRRP